MKNDLLNYDNKIWIEFYCAGNLGDDLLVANFILKTNFSSYKIIVPKQGEITDVNVLISMSSILKLTKGLNVEFITHREFWDIKKANLGDFYTKIGGSIWYEKNLEELLSKYTKIKNRGFRLLFSSTNFSSYTSKKSIKNLKKIVSLCDFFSLRDIYSKELIKHDSFNFDSVYTFPFSKYIKENKVEKNLIISYTNPNPDSKYYFDTNKYELLIKKNAVDYLNSQENGKVKFVLMQNRKDYFLAKEFIQKNLKKYESRVEIISYFCPIEIINIFNSAEKIIGTRFHSIIIANALKKSLLSIAYAPKVMNHLNDLGVNNEIEPTFIVIDNNKLKNIFKSSQLQFETINSIS